MADGVYAGAVDVNKWGPVQVQMTTAGGLITDVTALQSPSSERKSVRINADALPVLEAQAIASQSAQIDGVSGATYTSDSYRISLQSAIDQATTAA